MKHVDVDADDVLEDVARVLQERETGRSQIYHSQVREVGEIIYLMPGTWQTIADSLTALDQSLDEPVGVAVSGGVKGLFKRVIEKAIRWYVHPILAQLHRMHGAIDRLMHEMADMLKSANDRLEAFEKENLPERVRALEGDRFAERIGRLERAWRQAAPTGERPEEVPGPAAAKKLSPARFSSDKPFHFDYYWFESIHRGDREVIKKRLQPYLQFFLGCSNVIDIGCGRGEFLELLGERGVKSYGIDIESDAVQYCADLDLDVRQEEALEHLASLPDETLDGAFLAQVAEHLAPGELIDLVGLLYSKMKSGGHVIVETPNPQCLLIFASFFYADLSHVQPIHPETMRFLLVSAGFHDIDVQFINPVPRNQRLAKIARGEKVESEAWMSELNENLEKLNSVLFSYMDYAAIGRK